LEIERSYVWDNEALLGGGLFLDENSGDLTVRDSTLFFNQASVDGGGAFVCGAFAEFDNSTVSGNQTDRNGGGLYACSTGTVFLANTTVSENWADFDQDDSGDGGGLYTNGGTITALNSLISGNFDRTDFLLSQGPDCAGSLSSVGYNLIGTLGRSSLVNPVPVCEITGTTTGNLVGVSETLGPLDLNGGPTPTHALLPESLSVDSGNPAGCWDLRLQPLEQDQRGWSRPNQCDRGSFELGAEQPALIFEDGFESSDTSAWSDEFPCGPDSTGNSVCPGFQN
jgi:hypothetical protein